MKSLLFAAVSAAALTAAAPAADVEFRFDMNAAEAQAYYDEMTADGWRYRAVDLATMTKGVRYAMAFSREPQPARAMARSEMTFDMYNAANAEALADKMRLTDISIADESGGGLFAAIWEPDGPTSWMSRSGMTLDEFATVYERQIADKMRLTDVDCYLSDGQMYYAAIFEKRDGPEWYAFSDMTVDSAQKRYDEMLDKKFRPSRITACAGPDGPRFAQIFVKDQGETWSARTGMSEADFAAASADADSKGLTMIDFSAYIDGGQDRYAAIWLK